ncbi:hypothetical protein [Streptomyces sp. NBC_01244]|uniref:hypothetical protein n=1 Tax=Streptomyces sp. NBC_01244 TaxID=2903797 RepID=UPI002E12C57D|nr:hypothetical protein OG247_37535 [Streptomyces sp. NBC_01244]
MGDAQDTHKEPGKGREAQEHHRSGDPARPQPGKASRKQGQKQGREEGPKETSRRREDDLLREEDLHDETL